MATQTKKATVKKATTVEKPVKVVNLNSIEISKVDSKKKAEILRPQPNIYLSGKVVDLAELIYRCFIGREATYLDEDCTKIQTSHSRRRSIEDLFMLTKTYFPKISYLRLEERVKALYESKEGIYISHDFCDVVKREVHYPGNIKISVDWVRKYLPNNLVIKG